MARLSLPLLALCCASLQWAAGETVLVVFSDSLSDNGSHGNGSLSIADDAARQAALKDTFASHWNGRFSNGWNWNDYLLGHPFDRLVNYAYGGAGACPDSGAGFSGASAGGPPNGTLPSGGLPSGGMPPGGGGGGMTTPLCLVNQTERYLAEQQEALMRAGTDRVVVVWIGGNEMRGALSQDEAAANATLDKMVGCIEESIRALLDSGETRLAVGMPTFYGLGIQTGQTRAQWVAMMVAAAVRMTPMLAGVRAEYPDAAVQVWDVAGTVMNLTLTDPPIQPFTNNTAACLEGGARRRRALLAAAVGTVASGSDGVAAAAAYLAGQQPVDGIISQAHCSNPDNYTYGDEAHPTASAHLALARSFADFLVASGLLEGVNVSTYIQVAAPSPVAVSPANAAAAAKPAAPAALAALAMAAAALLVL